MRSACWHRQGVVAGLAMLAALAMGGPARANSAPDELTAAACASHPEPYPPGTSLAALTTRLRAVQPQGDAFALEGACRGWLLVLRDQPGDALLALAWQSEVAAGLFWTGRSAQALPLFEALYVRYQDSGAAGLAQAGATAGMLSVIHQQRAQPAQALAWSQRAVDALANTSEADGNVTASDRLRVRQNHGVMLSTQRRFAEAETVLQGVLRDALAQPEALAAEAASALSGLAVLARRQGQFSIALACTDRELALRRQRVRDDPVSLVNALQNRGVVLIALARYDEAEAALRTALDEAGAVPPGSGVDLFGHQSALRETLSGLLLERGQPAQALALAEEAVQRVADRPEARTARGARPLRRLAEAQLALGNLHAGLATYHRALALLASGSGTADADTTQALRLGYARLMTELGDPAEAEAALAAAAADVRPQTSYEQARGQSLRAVLALRRGDADAALKAWQAADAALAGSLPVDHPQRQLLRAQQCALMASACTADADGGDLASRSPEVDALIQLALARRARADGHTAQAEAAARQALAAALGAGQPRLLWQAQATLAQTLADAGQLGQAIFLGKLALRQIEGQRERLLPLGQPADAQYLTDKVPVYRQVADWLLQSQRIAEALAVMDLLKRQEQSQVQQRASGDGIGQALALTAAEQAALHRLDAQLSDEPQRQADLQRLSQQADAQRITAAELGQLASLRQDERQQRSLRLQGLARALDSLPAAPAGGAAAETGPAHARRPNAGTLHAYLLSGDHSLSLLTRGPHTTELLRLPLPRLALTRQIAQWRDDLQRPPDALPSAPPEVALQLGRALHAAGLRHGAQRLSLWLDGPLRYLPPGLLHDGQRHLTERYELVLIGGPQGAEPASPPARRPPMPRPMVAFGVTRTLQGLPALPAVADELCNIVDGVVLGAAESGGQCGPAERGRGPLAGRGRLNEHFTEATLRSAAQPAAPGGLLHISTHFVLRPGHAAKSWLLLGDGERLTLAQLHQLPLGRPRLVTLSACETAVAAQGDGREVDSLAEALLDNGADQVLASLWRVDDRATAVFMRDFYAAYARLGGDAAAALRAAQRQAIAKGLPGNQWAAFVLMSRG